MKRFKLPNGFGSVVFYSGNRRNPWIVKKTIHGKQKIIGQFATYEDGISFLVEYNKNPALFTPSLITFKEIYGLMAAEKYPKIAKSTAANYTAAYKHCQSLYSKKFVEIKIGDLQNIINTMSIQGVGYATQKKCRQLLHHMYNYAIKYEIIPVTSDISRYIDIDQKEIVYPKKPFNTRQINRIKKLADSNEPLSNWAKTILMLIYSGARTGEFLSVLKSDVKIQQRYYIIRDSKTAAGRNRAVPINKKTLPYFKEWISTKGKTLITNNDGSKLTYHQYRSLFDRVMIETRCKHTPHECRHTCATLLDNAGANDTAIKRILGHASQGVTKGVYTHKSIHELKKAIDLI